MRDYAKVSPQFWIGETGRQIRQLAQPDNLATQLVALYLVTSPHANMVGIYYLPIVLIAHEVGISIEKAMKCLETLRQLDYCSYDKKNEYIWVHEMASYQIDAALKPNDNRVKNINSIIQALPALSYLPEFYQRYQISLCLNSHPAIEKILEQRVAGLNNTDSVLARANVVPHESSNTPFEGPSKSLRSQEQEQEKEQKQEQEQEQEKRARDPWQGETLTLPLLDGSESTITEQQIQAWQKAYPMVDIVKTLIDIREWNIVNPHRRKTQAGIHKHITDWFIREQNRQYQSPYPKYPPYKTLTDFNREVGEKWLLKSASLVINSEE